ncbi:MAG: hypothetical protein CM15mV19_1790 [uncultured marine virus]|nr:MAG: hypothetical protein CM15mV19_1790 [uncultured marine virus]
MKMFMDAKSLMFDVDNFNFLTYNNAKDEKESTDYSFLISIEWRPKKSPRWVLFYTKKSFPTSRDTYASI